MANTAPLSYLLDLLGVRFIKSQDIEVAESRTLNFLGTAVTVSNNPATKENDVNISVNGLEFTNSEAGGGNPTLKVSAERTDTIVTLLTATNVNKDFDLIPDNAVTPVDGYYQFSVYLVVKKIAALTNHRLAAVIDGTIDGGTLTIVGVQVELPGGDDTGFTLVLSAVSNNLRANLANASGETVNGYIEIYWLRTDPIP